MDSQNGLSKKFAVEHKANYYERWVKKEGLRIISARYVPDLRKVELDDWQSRGGRGVFINHEDSAQSNDCYVCEIPPASSLNERQQLFEEMIYILEGNGSTTVWNHEGKKVSFEWGPGSLFAIPLNTRFVHNNLSGKRPAKFVAVTNAPMVMNIFEDEDFIFNTGYDFKSRFNGEEDYFEAKTRVDGFYLDTNFVSDVRTLKLVTAKERGGGGGHIRFNLSRGTMNAHISEFAVGKYKKGHRHGPGAFVIILSGSGYSLMWPEGSGYNRYDWHDGTLITPPNMWFHQHFNTGRTNARYLALKYEGTAIRNEQGVPKAWISRREGGDQIDYSDEDPYVRELFKSELEKNGVEFLMQEEYDKELVQLSTSKK
ncbi:MAG TPA: hypothetical protein VKU79_04875 [Thermoplasmataceae archaeon]|nr:hypothetical protein [Thermoplasmatales archaeon AK]HLH86178.1 hypothetical protein [Thermoplasmataceae archaeon]